MATTGNSDDDHDPYEAYEDSKKTLDNNSVGPKFTLERANEHTHAVNRAPRRGQRHQWPTTTVHQPPSFEPQQAAPWKLDKEAVQDASLAESRQVKSQ
jgi:hypothetical protein